MRIHIPADLPADPVEAYKRGWRDRSVKAGKRGGSVSSPAKRAAARENGKKHVAKVHDAQ